jgi:hemerythrin superfamily protein
MSVVEKMKSYIGAYSATDIRSLLHADHEQISALTERISSDESKQKRIRAFDHLKPFLTAHARAEEQAVYIPLVKLRGSPDSRADGNEGFVEHSLVDVLMERLSKTELAPTDAWKAHAHVLQEMLDQTGSVAPASPLKRLACGARHGMRNLSRHPPLTYRVEGPSNVR